MICRSRRLNCGASFIHKIFSATRGNRQAQCTYFFVFIMGIFRSASYGKSLIGLLGRPRSAIMEPGIRSRCCRLILIFNRSGYIISRCTTSLPPSSPCPPSHDWRHSLERSACWPSLLSLVVCVLQTMRTPALGELEQNSPPGCLTTSLRLGDPLGKTSRTQKRTNLPPDSTPICPSTLPRFAMGRISAFVIGGANAGCQQPGPRHPRRGNH